MVMLREAYTRLAVTFNYCEHGCAVSYAVCEFSSHFHAALEILSATMLIAGFSYVVFRLGEKLAIGEKIAKRIANRTAKKLEEDI